jgi:hypothetical protein
VATFSDLRVYTMSMSFRSLTFLAQCLTILSQTFLGWVLLCIALTIALTSISIMVFLEVNQLLFACDTHIQIIYVTFFID